MDVEVTHGRSLATIIAELKEELREFVQTRVELLSGELQEKLQVFKAAAPLAATAALFLGTAYVLLTLALVGLLLAAFAGDPFRWFFAFLIVGFVWFMVGALAAVLAVREFKKGLLPRRTIQVLKADKAWLQREAKEPL